MYTAFAYLSNESLLTKIKVIMYSAYKRTFIDTAISRKFNLEILGKEKLETYVFGSKPKKSILNNKVKVKLRSIYYPEKTISIEAIETPNISKAEIESPVKKFVSFEMQPK